MAVCMQRDCSAVATVVSSSGHSHYCEPHSHCQYCGGSVTQFMLYMDTLYVCPCVAAFAEQTAREQELRMAKQVVLL